MHMDPVLWSIVALVIATATVRVAKTRQLQVVAINPRDRATNIAARGNYPHAEKSATAWYRRQDTGRRSIWLKQW